jgi:Fe(3+) dicitrate transport protein
VLYQNQFNRQWYRLDHFRDGTSLRDVTTYPELGTNGTYLSVLKGDLDSSVLPGNNGDLIVLNNHRTFVSRGIQSQFSDEEKLGATEHKFVVGARVHADFINRDHTFDTYSMTSRQMVRTADASGQEDSQLEKANTRLAHFKDDIVWNDWILTPAARYEEVNFNFENFLSGTVVSRKDTAFVPGLSLLRKLSPTLSTRVSANRAVTLAGLDSNGHEKKEESVNYEWAWTYYVDERSPQFDLVFFYNDYKNITGTCTNSTGCNASQLDVQFDGGRAVINGIEARYAQGFQWGKVWLPVQMNASIINAYFNSAFDSSTPEWGNGMIEKGDPLPYVPQLQYNLVLGAEYREWSQEISVIYQGKMFDQSFAVGREEIDPYGIVDWRGAYKFGKDSKVFLQADNLFAKNYVSSLRPFGYRPGKPRSFAAGISYSF